jgi:hypothetical protein
MRYKMIHLLKSKQNGKWLGREEGRGCSFSGVKYMELSVDKNRKRTK